MTLPIIVISVTVIYSAFMVAVGYYAYKRTELKPVDYFLGGRSLGTFVLSMTFVATYASMWTFMGAVGSNYRLGLSFMSAMITWNIMWPFILLVFGSRLWLIAKKYDYITPADMFADYYKSELVRVVASIIGVVALVPYISIQLIGGGLAFEAATVGMVPYWAGALFMLLIMIVYTSIGGLKAIAWTDVIQGVFFLGILFILAVWALSLSGTNPLMNVHSVNPELFVPGNWSWGFWLGFVLTWGLSPLLPHQMQRCFMARNGIIIARSSGLLAILSGWVQTIPVFIIGIAGSIILPDLVGAETDQVVVLLVARYAPIVAAIITAAAIAAGKSTLDAQLLTASSLVTKDLYHRYSKPDATDNQQAVTGRVVVIILGVIIYVFALTRPGFIVDLATAGAAIAIAGYLPATLGVLFWPRLGTVAATASMIVGGSVALITFIAGHPLDIHNAIWGISAGLLTAVILAPLTKPLPYEDQERVHGLLAKVMHD